MKFAVVIALFGLAAATQKHNSQSFIQTKFVNFNELADDEAPEKTAEDLRVQAEIAKKASQIAKATKEVEATEAADLVKTNKEKKAEAKKLSDAIAAAASKHEMTADNEDEKACDKQKAALAAEKAAKDKKVSDFAAMVKDKTSDMDWAASMPEDIVSHSKFGAGPLKYANVQI